MAMGRLWAGRGTMIWTLDLLIWTDFGFWDLRCALVKIEMHIFFAKDKDEIKIF